MTERYPGSESKSLEFKSTIPHFNNLIKTCVAFANGPGGKIVFGVEDKTQKIIGITDKMRVTLYDQFLDCLYDSTQPAILARIFEQNFNEKSVVILEVVSSSRKPCFIKKEGIPKGVYLRVGSHTRRATEEYIEDLTRETMRISYDEEGLFQPKEILSKALLENIYGKNPSEKVLLSEHVLTRSPVNSEKLLPTVAATLFFTESPHQFIHEACVLCTEFKGIEGRDIIASREITGPIPQLLHDTLALIKAWLERNYALKGPSYSGSLPVPETALREALINALLHRKYSIPGAVKVAIWTNRIEIFSPGCFPGLVDIDHLGTGITYLRNPILARLAHKIGLIERLGTGIKLIFDTCDKMKTARPVFNEDGDFVKVIFFFSKTFDPTLSDEEIILQFVKTHMKITAQDVVRILTISKNSASRKLAALVNKGKLIRRGSGPITHYIFRS